MNTGRQEGVEHKPRDTGVVKDSLGCRGEGGSCEVEDVLGLVKLMISHLLQGVIKSHWSWL